MNKRAISTLVQTVLITALAGCAGQQQSTGPVEPLSLPGISRAEAMELAEQVLAEMHFVIDKADFQHGIIRTRPLAGAQFFELWRSDNVGSFNHLEANIHSIRRWVELSFETPPGQQQPTQSLRIHCTVHTERLSLPERPVSSSARAYAMFSKSSASLQRIQLNPEQQALMGWEDLGQDNQLARAVLEKINEKLSRRQEQQL